MHPGGSITINSTNPLDYPIIDPNVLSSPFDQYALTYAWKSIQRFVAAPAWSDYIVSPVGALANVTTDEELLALLKTEVGLFHIAGTCSFSPKGADWGVVDPDLTLKNATGVRVIDASVLVSSFRCVLFGFVLSFFFLELRSRCSPASCRLRYRRAWGGSDKGEMVVVRSL